MFHRWASCPNKHCAKAPLAPHCSSSSSSSVAMEKPLPLQKHRGQRSVRSPTTRNTFWSQVILLSVTSVEVPYFYFYIYFIFIFFQLFQCTKGGFLRRLLALNPSCRCRCRSRSSGVPRRRSHYRSVSLLVASRCYRGYATSYRIKLNTNTSR